MAKKKKKKKTTPALGTNQSKRIAQLEEAVKDAEDALRIADRNIKSLKKKFPLVFGKQRRCRVQKTQQS